MPGIASPWSWTSMMINAVAENRDLVCPVSLRKSTDMKDSAAAIIVPEGSWRYGRTSPPSSASGYIRLITDIEQFKFMCVVAQGIHSRKSKDVNR